MGYIQTINRVIKTKESYEQITVLMDLKFFEIIEDCSFIGQTFGHLHKSERKIKINREFIVEIYDS